MTNFMHVSRSHRLRVLPVAILLIAPLLGGCWNDIFGSKSNSAKSDASKTSASTPAVTRAPDPNDPVVARVNGTEIRQSDLAIAEEDLGPNSAAMTPESKREYLVTYLADILLVAKAAEGKTFTEEEDFKRRLQLTRNKLIAQFMLESYIKSAATEEAMRKFYDDAVKGLPVEDEARVRHILIRVVNPADEKQNKEAENKIKALIDRLKKGEDFAALATEFSDDTASKQRGGLLEYFVKKELVPEFSNVAFQLEKGQVSGPVRTQYGWHVLKLEDKRPRKPPEFEQVKDQVQSAVMRKAQTEFITKLREDAKIERLYKTDKPDKPATPDTPAPPADPDKK